MIEANGIEDENNDFSAEKVALNKALDRLKPDERFLVVLYSEGLSYKEMAEVTEIKFSSIGKTLSRILKKIEIELKSQCDELYN